MAGFSGGEGDSDSYMMGYVFPVGAIFVHLNFLMFWSYFKNNLFHESTKIINFQNFIPIDSFQLRGSIMFQRHQQWLTQPDSKSQRLCLEYLILQKKIAIKILISAGLEPVLSYTEKSFIVLYPVFYE